MKCSNVLPNEGVLWKILVTMGTRVDIINSMDVHMLLESVDLIEWLITNGALIGGHFSGMNLDVAG